jgi:hypothetical protein
MNYLNYVKIIATESKNYLMKFTLSSAKLSTVAISDATTTTTKANTAKTAKATKTETVTVTATKKYRKKKIPKALREQTWIATKGRYFSETCSISWCSNEMNCFNFDCGHNIPESKGGLTNVENLIPICRNCNLGMGNRFTIEEWEKKYETPKKWYQFSFWT